MSTVFKLAGAGSRELWLDETHSAFVGSLPFRQMLHYISGDVHPPLYFALLWGWIRLAGDGAMQLRTFSVLLSAIGAAGTFAVGRRWSGDNRGFFAALLFCFSPLLFVYSLEVRMYMLAACGMVALLGMHWRVVIQRRTGWPSLALYGFAAALLSYSHYIGLFLAAGLFLAWLVDIRLHAGRMKPVLIAAGVAILLLSPWIPVLSHQRTVRMEQQRALLASDRDSTTLGFGGAPFHQMSPRLKVATFFAGAASASGMWVPNSLSDYGSRAATLLLFVALALPVALMVFRAGVLALRGDPLCRLAALAVFTFTSGVVILGQSQIRYFVPLAPVLFLAYARTIPADIGTIVWRRSTKCIAAAAVLVLLLHGAGFTLEASTNNPQPWGHLAAFLKTQYAPEDIVVFHSAYSQVTFDYFAKQAAFRPQEDGVPKSIYRWWEEQPFKGWGGPVLKPGDLDSKVAALENRPRTIWLVEYETFYYDPHEALLQRLRRDASVEGCDTVRLRCDASAAPGGEPRLYRIRSRGETLISRVRK